MKTIWRLPIPIRDRFTLEMPLGAQILSFQIQRNQPVIWAMVDTDQRMRGRVFEIHGIGNPMRVTESLQFIGTIQDGDDVWHLFEVPCLEHAPNNPAPLKSRPHSADKHI